MAEMESNPRHHTQQIRQRLHDVASHLREDVRKVDEPQFRAMAETAAEVIFGLEKAFSDYEKHNEAAWR